jgi:hypothetical protein
MLAQSNLVAVLGWAVYDVARTSLDVKAASLRIGLIGLSQFLPVLLINPFAGLVADRHDRRLVVRLALLAQILAVGVLVVLQALGRADLPVFYLVAAGFAAGRGFYAPAMSALAPALVPAEILPRAIAVSAIAGRIGGIVGPVLGGFAHGVAPDFAYGLTLALRAALLAQLAIGPHGANRPVADGKPLAHILEGLRYVAHNRMLLGAISLDLFAVCWAGRRPCCRSMPGHSPCGPSRAWAVALRLVRRRRVHRVVVVVAPRGERRGAQDASRRCVVRRGFGRVRDFALAALVAGHAGPGRRGGHDFGLCTADAGAGGDARCDAWARGGDIGAVHHRVQRAGEMESGVVGAILGPVGSVVFGGVSAVAIAFAWGRLFLELRHAALR